MEQKDGNWWYRDDDGRICGPFSLNALRDMCETGKVRPETAVSGESAPWGAAAASEDLPFDCLALQPQPDGGFCVLGPFPRDFLRNPEVRATLPADCLVFSRRGRLESIPAADSTRPENNGTEDAPVNAEIECEVPPPPPQPPRRPTPSAAALLEEQLRLELRRMAAARRTDGDPQSQSSRRNPRNPLQAIFSR